MKKIRLSYSSLVNAGDVLNVDLVELLSGKKVVRSKSYNADMTAIGGALFGVQYSNGFRKVQQKLLSFFFGRKPLYVWGSGFLYHDNPNPIYRTNLKVCALRGEKTREKLEDLTGQSYPDAVLADAGLLVDMLLDGSVEKKYEMGVIAHFSQQNEEPFLSAQKDPSVHFIDIRRPPKEVAEEIAACKVIASSSLHGLIFSDGMHIPSLRLCGKTALPGGEFKFEDYYSCYGVQDNPWRDQTRLPSVADVLERACVDFKLVDEKKEALLRCFPKW